MDEIRLKYDDGDSHKGINLPCGSKGYFDGTGVTCKTCFCVWGSISCPCSQEKCKELKDDRN